MTNSFHIVALDSQPFQELFSADTDDLKQLGIRHMVADTAPGYPCRVSLVDARPGEAVVLLSHLHHDVLTPYRASGAIFVREGAETVHPPVDEVPAMFRHRQLSVRGYDAAGMLVDADVTCGSQLENSIRGLFENVEIEYLQIHNAAQGCYQCRVERA
jgi:hypothetical protein